MGYLRVMKNAAAVALPDIRLPRVAQHVLFWLAVSIGVTGLYSVEITFLQSLRNNMFYMPVQIAYYYAIAYWLVPRYALTGRYVSFAFLLAGLALVTVTISRSIGLTMVIPNMIKVVPITNPDYLAFHARPFIDKIRDLPSMVNGFKGINLTIGFVLAIKLFKMWYERKQAALEAELSALKAQVHPHFLFNTLNNLYALSLNQSPKSPQVILGLSDILRYMLYECNADKVPLQKEVFMMQQYIKLEKLRYEDRIDIGFNVSGRLEDKLIAPLLILPFIENAFKHGASEQTGQVWIKIDISVREDHFKLKVANSKQSQPKTNSSSGQIGLKNVAKRLELLYPEASTLKIMEEEDTFLIVLDVHLDLVAGVITNYNETAQLVTT